MKSLRPLHLLLLAPSQALVTLLLAGPAAYVLWLSFTVSNYGENPQFVGWQNYASILSDPYFWTASVNTLILVNVVVYVELLLALAMALRVQSQKRGRALLFAAVLVPYGISEVVGVLAWRFLADPSFGLLSRSLGMIGITFDWTTDATSALVLVALISIWNHLPFSFILLYAALVSVPKEMHEAAQVDGAGAWQRFWYVTVPFIVPAALLAILFRYVFAFRMFSEVWLVTKGGPLRMTEVLGTYLYRTAFRYGDFGGAAATGWIMVIVTLLLASFYIRAMYRGVFKS